MMRRFEIKAALLLLTFTPALYAQAQSAEPEAAPPPETAPAEPPSAVAAPPAGTTPPPAPPAVSTPAASGAPAPGPELAPFPEPGPTGTLRPRAMAHAERASTRSAEQTPQDRPIPVAADAPPLVAAAAIPSVSAWLGFGALWVASDGLDPFAEDDALMLFSAGAALSIASAGELDVAAVLGWDTTSASARYRGESTSLDVMRFALGPELRGSIFDRLFWRGRVSPTLTRLSAELDESSSNSSLTDSRWLLGAEAALGLDFRFAEAQTPLPSALGFYLRLEAGYAWAPDGELSLEAEGSAAPVRTVALQLADLAPSGPVFRASIGTGF
jgi:hypothetical protein